MKNILSTENRNAKVLDILVRQSLPSAIGISTGPYGSRIHLPDNISSVDETTAQTILNQFGMLTVDTDKFSLIEGDNDPIITCDDTNIVGDDDLGYIALLDGDVYAGGTVSISSGEAALNLVSPIAGVYEIFMYRLTGDYASGSVQITVSEV